MNKSVLYAGLLLTAGLATSATLTGCSSDNEAALGESSATDRDERPDSDHTTNIDSPDAARWFADGRQAVQAAGRRRVNTDIGAAKNVILFVGDGMGISTVTAARILAGQRAGATGEEYDLSFDRLPYAALSKTYNTNAQTPDSAGTMSAMVTGLKTDMGVLSVAPGVTRGDCASAQGAELTTFLELAEMSGKSTGIVTTARLTHATPGATYAHTPERNWEDNSALPDSAVAAGCKDIADQFVSFDTGDGIEVAFGGGRRHFLPRNVTVEGSAGRRTDGRNLIEEWQAAHPQGRYVSDASGFNSLSGDNVPVLGLFEASHMRFEADRASDVAGEPSLTEMTVKAIQRLSSDHDGYFLMVESGRIDHAHHAGNAFNALNETTEFSEAIQSALDRVSLDDTLVVVTADHSHVFTMAGYPTRGNPILGKVVGNDASGRAKDSPTLADDDLPYTTLGYTNGQGFADLGNQTDAEAIYAVGGQIGRANLQNVDTQAPGYHQEALIPLGAETHAGEDVGIYAAGRGASLFNGTLEQNLIFHVMNHAAGLAR